MKSTDHAAAAGRFATRAAIASVGLALALLAAKSWAAWTTGSTAMLGSLADTALDVVASLTTLAGVRIAAQPADREHRFGHGKAEALVALAQVVLIAVSSVGIAWRAVDRLLSGQQTSAMELGIGVSVAAMAGTMALLWYQKRIIAKTDSIAIRTDNLHYRSDLALNGAVILALVLDQSLHISGADAFFGLGIAAWLLLSAYRGSIAAIDQLMDREWPDDERDAFLAASEEYPELKGLHDLRTRRSGMLRFVQFHVWVPGDWTVQDAHDRLDEVEEKLQNRFPGTEILIHLDPEGQTDRATLLPEAITERAR
ncbi:MAG: cation diffusion facilitator family transporter [Sphingomonas sp.]|nr:cation diffusion facilitator family transporter [Sphingomonas sp.]